MKNSFHILNAMRFINALENCNHFNCFLSGLVGFARVFNNWTKTKCSVSLKWLVITVIWLYKRKRRNKTIEAQWILSILYFFIRVQCVSFSFLVLHLHYSFLLSPKYALLKVIDLRGKKPFRTRKTQKNKENIWNALTISWNMRRRNFFQTKCQE